MEPKNLTQLSFDDEERSSGIESSNNGQGGEDPALVELKSIILHEEMTKFCERELKLNSSYTQNSMKRCLKKMFKVATYLDSQLPELISPTQEAP